MTWRSGAAAASLLTFPALDVAVLVAPALVLAAAARKGGLPGAHGIDLVIASAAIGCVHGAVVWRRLWSELRNGVRIIDASIAAFDALVVLALAATGLLIVVLGGFAQTHTVLLNAGWPVVGLWVAVQLGAVTLAEATRSAVLRWLEPPSDHVGRAAVHSCREAAQGLGRGGFPLG